jgi:peptidoglycan/xylan/chitin deacetylase (PgdA/CDA1 family)
MILMYHNVVTDIAPDGYKLTSITLPKSAFLKQILWIEKHFSVLSLEDYLEKKKLRKLTKRDVAITFDDGTAMTYDLIAPIFKHLKIPAAIFVSTCQLEGGDLIWGSTLNAICFESIYPYIELDGLVFKLKDAKDRLESRRLLGKMAQVSGNPTNFVRQLSEKNPIPSNLMPYYEGMFFRQLADAGKTDWATIGSHTVSHPYLSTLSENEQEVEIAESRSTLESLINKPVDYFCFPSGDYNSTTLGILNKMGYKAAFAVQSKKLGNDPMLEIPRTGIFSASMPKLRYKLGGLPYLFSMKSGLRVS